MNSTRRGFLGGLLALAAAVVVPFWPKSKHKAAFIIEGSAPLRMKRKSHSITDLTVNRNNFHQSRKGSQYFRNMKPYTYTPPS